MLLKTTKDKNHYHIAYLKDNGGITSENRNHHHLIQLMMLIPAPDGHTHRLTTEGTVVGKNAKAKTDDDVTTEVRNLYETARELETDFRTKGIESEKYARGKQWDETIEKDLESKSRAVLTINEIEPKLDLLSGYQRQNRYDIRYLPVEEGDARIADILTHVAKNITEQNNFDYEETESFEDSTIVGRGLIHAYINYDKNIQGDVVIEQFPWDECYFGPHNKKDLSDCEYLCKVKWYSKEKISGMWPDKADEIEADFDLYQEDEEGETHKNYAADQYRKSTRSFEVSHKLSKDYVDIARKEYRVIECVKKEYENVPIAINIADGFFHNVVGWQKSDVEMVRKIAGFKVIYRVKTEFRKIIIAGDVVLENEIQDITYFPIIPVYAKKRKEYIWGKVEAAKGPQDEINKRHSQLVDIMNRVAAYGWFYDSNTFESPKDRQDFEQKSSTPGFHLKVRDTNRPPAKVEGTKVPVEIIQLEGLSSEKLREIMNINPELLGLNSRAESGVAIIEKKRQGLIGNEFLFDNLSLAKRLLGRILISYIQKIYTPERILRILENRNHQSAIEIGGVPLERYSREELMELLSDQELSKYDVVVGESAYNPTTRTANFMIWMDAAGKGLPIPPTLLVDLSDLPEKDKVKKAMQEMINERQRMEQQKFDVELQKTVIAKGGGQSGIA